MSSIDEKALKGEITSIEAVLQKAQLVRFSAESLSDAEYSILRNDIVENLQYRCATEIVTNVARIQLALSGEQAQLASQLLARPSAQSTYDSPGGYFKLHYDEFGTHAVPSADTNSNNIPDYIERLGDIADSTWRAEVINLGYYEPVSDGMLGGDGRFDIYFQSLPFYGYMVSENPGPESWNDYSGYMVLHNDYVGFPPNDDPEGSAIGAAKVTLGHEFYHAIQYAYDRDDELWWMEASATWMEELVFDPVNDNHVFLPDFFSAPYRALTRNSNDHWYGAFVWPLYLAERFGPDLMKSVWEGARFVDGMTALHDSLPVLHGLTRDSAFIDFIPWICLTNGKDDGAHFPEAADYPTPTYATTVGAYPVINQNSPRSPEGYGSGLIRFLPNGASGVFKVTVNGTDLRDWEAYLICTATGQAPLIQRFSLDALGYGTAAIAEFESYDEVVLAMVNMTAYSISGTFTFSAEIVGGVSFVAEPHSDGFAFTLVDNPIAMDIINLAMNPDSFTVVLTDTAGWLLTQPEISYVAGLDDTLALGFVRPPSGTLPGAQNRVRAVIRSLTDTTVTDTLYLDQSVVIQHGDADWNGKLNIGDVTYLFARMFSGGPAPVPEESAGNANCDSKINIGDITYLIDRIFGGGPPPPCNPQDPI